jgi:hypothetical protein
MNQVNVSLVDIPREPPRIGDGFWRSVSASRCWEFAVLCIRSGPLSPPCTSMEESWWWQQRSSA